MRNLALRSLALAMIALAATGFAAEKYEIPTRGLGFWALDNRVNVIIPGGQFTTPQTIYLCENKFVPNSPLLVPDTAFSIGKPKFFMTNGFTIMVKYDVSAIPAGQTEGSLALHYVSNHRFQPLPSTVDTVNKTVAATIRSAGTYAILASPTQVSVTDDVVERGNGEFRRHRAFGPSGSNAYTEIIPEPNIGGLGTALSPRLDSFVYVRQNLQGTFDLWSCMPDGSYSTRISNIGFSSPPQVAVSPNGIYFAAKGYQNFGYRLFRGDNGRPSSQELHNSTEMLEPFLSWSFDSADILVSGVRSGVVGGQSIGVRGLRSRSASNGTVLRIIDGPTAVIGGIPISYPITSAAFAPNNKAIAYVSGNYTYLVPGNSNIGTLTTLAQFGSEPIHRIGYTREGGRFFLLNPLNFRFSTDVFSYSNIPPANRPLTTEIFAQ